MKRIILIVYFLTILSAQDLTNYFEELNKGNVESVRAVLPDLKEKYPNNPGVMFLDALSAERAEDAIIIYKMIIQHHPHSEYADDSVMKIGEYLYARGLYTQASRQLLRVPKLYPDSEHIQRAIDLQINSLLASGEKDSARFYLQIYKKRFPKVYQDYSFEPEEPVIHRSLEENIRLTKGDESVAPEIAPVSEEKLVRKEEDESEVIPEPVIKEPVLRPFVIQVGAYGSINNALRQKQLLEQMGYTVDLVPIISGGKELQAVQLVRFSTRPEAEEVGKKLKKELGYNFYVTKRLE